MVVVLNLVLEYYYYVLADCCLERPGCIDCCLRESGCIDPVVLQYTIQY